MKTWVQNSQRQCLVIIDRLRSCPSAQQTIPKHCQMIKDIFYRSIKAITVSRYSVQRVLLRDRRNAEKGFRTSLDAICLTKSRRPQPECSCTISITAMGDLLVDVLELLHTDVICHDDLCQALDIVREFFEVSICVMSSNKLTIDTCLLKDSMGTNYAKEAISLKHLLEVICAYKCIAKISIRNNNLSEFENLERSSPREECVVDNGYHSDSPNADAPRVIVIQPDDGNEMGETGWGLNSPGSCIQDAKDCNAPHSTGMAQRTLEDSDMYSTGVAQSTQEHSTLYSQEFAQRTQDTQECSMYSPGVGSNNQDTQECSTLYSPGVVGSGVRGPGFGSPGPDTQNTNSSASSQPSDCELTDATSLYSNDHDSTTSSVRSQVFSYPQLHRAPVIKLNPVSVFCTTTPPPLKLYPHVCKKLSTDTDVDMSVSKENTKTVTKDNHFHDNQCKQSDDAKNVLTENLLQAKRGTVKKCKKTWQVPESTAMKKRRIKVTKVNECTEVKSVGMVSGNRRHLQFKKFVCYLCDTECDNYSMFAGHMRNDHFVEVKSEDKIEIWCPYGCVSYKISTKNSSQSTGNSKVMDVLTNHFLHLMKVHDFAIPEYMLKYKCSHPHCHFVTPIPQFMQSHAERKCPCSTDQH